MRRHSTWRVVVIALAVGFSLFSTRSFSAPATKGKPASPEATTALKPETFAPKALLEDLLVRRYTQELATLIDRQLFTLGAQIELSELPPGDTHADDDSTNNEFPADISLGTLTSDEVLKHYASADVLASSTQFLRNYRIRSVAINVGLKAESGDQAKTQVETWLKTRVSSEFGAVGKGAVSLIRVLPDGKSLNSPKSLLDWLNQFQDLAGKILLALVGLLGLIVWVLRSPGASKSEVEGATESASNAGAASPSADAGASTPDRAKESASGSAQGEQESAAAEAAKLAETRAAEAVSKRFRQITRNVSDLAPKASAELDRMIRSWCQAGEDGRVKLACFAEALGKNLGKLPIPGDMLVEISQAFSKMPELTVAVRCKSLEQVYWDLMSTISLGPEALEPPFSYLGSLKIDSINQMLIDQNPKMRAMVAIHMPTDVRAAYLASLGFDVKRELILASAGLASIPADEFKSMDGSLRMQIQQGNGGPALVKFEAPLLKLVEALSPIEEIKLLGELQGPVAEEIARSTLSLAYAPLWPERSLATLLSRATPEEALTLARVLPGLKESILTLSPNMISEVLADELEREDKIKDTEKTKHLLSLRAKALVMVERKELNLQELKPTDSSTTTSKEASDDSMQSAA